MLTQGVEGRAWTPLTPQPRFTVKETEAQKGGAICPKHAAVQYYGGCVSGFLHLWKFLSC